MKTINFFYRIKKYGKWIEASVETNIPDLSRKELLHLCQRQIDEKAIEITYSNPQNN